MPPAGEQPAGRPERAQVSGQLPGPGRGCESALSASSVQSRFLELRERPTCIDYYAPAIAKACHELRIQDANRTWRIVYHVDATAIAILEVFTKTTQQTPKAVIDICKARLRLYISI